MKKLSLILVIFVFFSCTKKDEEKSFETVGQQLAEKLVLNDMIVQTPAQIISAKSTIELTFRDPVVPAHLSESTLDENPFTFEPEIEGYARWKSTRVLEFVPAHILSPGIQVKANLNGKILLGDQKNVDDFLFNFKVAEQEILSLQGDFVPVPEVKNAVRYKGTLTLAQPALLEKINDDLIFEGPNGKISIDLKQSQNQNEIVITSETINRKKTGQSFKVLLPSVYTAENKNWEQEIFLSGIDVFRVLAHMDMTDSASPQSVYGFRLSEPIKKQTDLSGYIRVSPSLDYKLRIKDKYILLEADFVPAQSYTITISRGFPSIYNNQMENDYQEVFSISNIKPKIEWLSRGIYLPTNNKFKLQFKSVNVARARLEITEIFPQNIGFFLQHNVLTDPDAEMERNRYYYAYNYSDLSRVGEEIYYKVLTITSEKNHWVKTELDLDKIFKNKKNSTFVVSLRFESSDLTGRCVNNQDESRDNTLYFPDENYYDNPAKPGYYYRNGSKSKLLISSNIGLTAKKTTNGVHVFAVDILNAQPVSNLTLNLHSRQNKLLESKKTDAAGYIHFENKGDYILGNNASGIALIKLDHRSWILNNFDVAGRSLNSKNTDMFIYTDRDVHRPGDVVHLSAIVRVNSTIPPEKQPVLLEVKNPQGQIVHNDRKPCGSNGHVYFPISTEMTDPTGNWLAEVSLGDQKFTRVLRIETIKPFRLKIDTDLPTKIMPPYLKIDGTITSKYLFGAPASKLETVVKAQLSKSSFAPPKYTDFIFSSPLKTFQERQLNVFKGKLNEGGKIRINYRLPDLSQTSHPLNARITTRVYEKGGSFTSQSEMLKIYPHLAQAGIKNIFKSRSVRIGEKYQVPIVVVDTEGKPVKNHRLQVAVYVNRDHWWWDYDRREQRDFRIMESTYLIEKHNYLSSGEPVLHTMSVEDYGRHYIEVKDLENGHEAGIFFYVSGWGQLPVEERKRNYLQISSDKNVYNIGDQAKLSFESPQAGMALLTVEQGSRIISTNWKNVSPGQTTFTVNLNKEMLPNCYASISMIQPHNQNTNDVPMRLYGIKTLYVEDKNTRLPLTMDVPSELKPKEKFSVRISSHASLPATCTIAIVDEGLLDITGFETPDPWNYFFEKIRLGVTTMDNYDEILGLLFPDIDKYFSIGGGLMADARKKRLDKSQTRRFKPAVLFQEPIQIEPGQTITTPFTMPNYVGAVRVMVIGTAGHSYISLEETIPVKQPLTLLPTVPRLVRPGDNFALPVSVFALDEAVKEAKISLEISSNLSVLGPLSKTVTFAKPGESDIKFMLKAGEEIGTANITIKGVSGPNEADYSVALPVVSANPFYTDVQDTMIQPDQAIKLIPKKIGLAGTNKAKIALSRMPDIQLDKRYSYLLRYPYGCIEQTVSAAFPQLFLNQLVDLREHQKKAVTDHINAAIKRLSNFRTGQGFSFWPASSSGREKYSDWGSSYAGHFLVEAKVRGYHVPDALYQHWLEDAKERAKDINKKDHRYQAYRLFVLALSGEAQIGTMNLLREDYLGGLDPLSKQFLAASYFLNGQKKEAAEIERHATTEITDYREMSRTYGSALRDRSLIAYLKLKMDDQATAAKLLRDIYKSYSPGRWYSTQETAMTLLCVGTYYDQYSAPGGAVSYKIKMGEGEEKTAIVSGYQSIIELDNMWDKEIQITNESGNPLFVTLFREGIPIEDRIKSESYGLTLQRNFYNEQGQPITVGESQQAKQFWVIYTVTCTYASPLKELALSSIFPAGWEIINSRLGSEPLPSWVNSLGLSMGSYMDIRDDRINWFFDLNSKQKIVLGTKINPTFSGEYTMPAVVVEPMYSPEFYARIKGDVVRVK